tara:strand:+ start:864 stop:1508 length:645 start_codon:yes stop_codon:yes gene_type:complete
MSAVYVDSIKDKSDTKTLATLSNTSVTLHSDVAIPASVGGVMVFLEKFTADNTTSEKIFNLDSFTSYKKYLFSFNDVRPASDGAHLQIATGTSSSSFNTTAGDYRGAFCYGYYNGTSSGTTQDAINDFLYKGVSVGDSIGEGLCGQLFVYNPTNSALCTSLNGTMTFVNDSHNIRGQSCGGVRMAATDDAYIKMYFTSGNIKTGTIILYGVKDA